ncbi:16S rRNA (guanine(1207)-N(2))-methyltransferase RsmC [Buchnera aphidicola]|uniref:16S rRNA (guanine(1207)-N(2))-methyltransferase RsmC n=1 Tax=Buchnera aphidicola TaxID=9 RepID=UPI003463DC49
MNVHNANIIVMKYLKNFKNQNILFSGNISKDFFLYFKLTNIRIHVQQDYHPMLLKILKKNNICFRIIPRKNFVLDCNILIFFWRKNKLESQFQIIYFLSVLKKDTEIFIIGKTRSGVNCVKNFLKHWVDIKKIYYKNRYALYYGKIIQNSIFIFKKYFKKYIWNNLIIYTLPGVFDYKRIDNGSILLISTFDTNLQGKILDIGCGSGILSIALNKISDRTKITLIDNNSTAILCSKINLRKNHVKAKIILSNIYSDIQEKFNLIISNPSTHSDIKNNFNVIKKIIQNSKKYLKKNGELRMVVHSHISCKKEFLSVFNHYKIIAKYRHFNVHQGILK